MKNKIVLTLTLAVLFATVGCGDSKSPTLSYITRDMSGSSNPPAPQLFKLNESTQLSTAVQIPIPTTAYYISANNDATLVTYCRDHSSDNSGNYDIFLMGTDGVEKQLTTNANACESVFSSDGKTMAFVSGASGDYLIMTMNLDGTNQQALFTPAAGTAESFDPEFAPDGKSLVFFTYTNGGPSAARQPHLNGRTSPWLTQFNARSKKAHPAVAGTGITQSGWYTMGVSDTAPTFVYTPNYWWGPAVFTGDGKKLLITDSDGSNYNVSSINLDGTGLTALTASTDTDDIAPVPYKTLIMFNRYNSTNNSWEIWAMDQAGNNQTLVHSTADTWEGLVDSYWD